MSRLVPPIVAVVCAAAACSSPGPAVTAAPATELRDDTAVAIDDAFSAAGVRTRPLLAGGPYACDETGLVRYSLGWLVLEPNRSGASVAAALGTQLGDFVAAPERARDAEVDAWVLVGPGSELRLTDGTGAATAYVDTPCGAPAS